jgi:DNA-binding transcriptional MocR family regulator
LEESVESRRNHPPSGDDEEVPELNYRSAHPPSAQIADWIRDGIRSGKYRPGDPVPSEKWLQDKFGVARDTGRRAVAILRAEGAVYTVPQRGTYVRDPDCVDGPPAGYPRTAADSVPGEWHMTADGDVYDIGYLIR